MSVAAVELEDLYWEEGLSTRKIGKALDVDHGTVINWMRKYHIPRRPSNGKKLQVDLSPSPDLAYIIGVQYGDGWISFNGKKYSIGLTAKDRDFVEQFSEAVWRVKGGIKPSVYLNCGYPRTEAVSRALYEFLSDRWLHTEIIEAYPANFIRGFADSEGSVYIRRFKNPNWKCRQATVRLYNTSLDLLMFIKGLLKKRFSINSTIKVNIRKGTVKKFSGKEKVFTKNVYALLIYRKADVRGFCKRIGFSIERKMKKLKEITTFWEQK